MIIAKSILGRLGNQMFQYAYCKAIKEMVGGTLAFSFDKVYCQKEVDKNDNGFEDSLCFFNVDDYIIFEGDIHSHYCNRVQHFLYRSLHFIRRKWFKDYSWQLLFSRIGLYYYNDKNNDFHIDIQYLKMKSLFPKSILCYDYLEVPNRFESIRPILLNEFTPKHPPLESNTDLYKLIDSNEKVKELIDNPVLIFFSDDIRWVEKNIKSDLPSYYESGDDPIWEKMRLMYSCKHFIISNSTFSWWAQYLSRNDKKIVISPDHWTNDKNKDAKHLISNDFITIPCGKPSNLKKQ